MREIQTSLLPFHLHRKTITVPEGVTLEEMVKFVMPSSVEGVDIVVNIGDSVVPEELWKTIRPKNNAMVGINIVPAGSGGSTGRKILATIVAIVIVTVAITLAPYTGGGSLTLLGALTVTTGTVVASLAYSMIAGVPKQKARGGGAAGDISESPTQFVEGSTNAVKRYGVVPANLGVNRMFPPQAALPFTETSGNDQYSRQLFTYGYGNITLSDIKIGETLVTEFTGVQLQHKLSSDLSDGVSLYPSDYFQESLSILLEKADGYATRTTQQNVDEFEIDITFQQGLVTYDNTGARQKRTVELQAEYRVTGSGGDFTALSPTTVTNATGEAVRVSIRAVLPAQNQYDVRIKRKTHDSVSTRVLDKVHWTALKNVTYGAPVLKEGLSGSALRILATDQLNGTVDRFNAIVSTSILNYDNGSSWETGISSNPAAIYRYVLQSPAFIKNLVDARIDVDALEDWSDYCALKGLTYNRVVDYETSIDDLLNDIAASGMATPHKVHGIYGVIVDNERPVIKGMVTPRNSWNYKGNITYPEIPHGLRVEFRNPTIGYETDERIVYADGYTAANATLLERLQFTSCTDPEAAYYYARLYLASAKLQPETHTFKMDIENLSFNRGDRIVFVNDTILVGVGQGRIKELVYDNPGSPTTVVSVVIDDFITIPSASNFAARIRHHDASGFNYYSLTTSVGETNTLTFTTPIAVASAPGIGSLCSFVEDGLELDLLIKDIKLDKNVNASITAINYAPARFDAATGVIPAFNSNVTLPADLFAPFAPQSGGAILSDETVMSRNSDGSFVTRMIIPLLNINTIGVEPVVKIRVTGATTWTKPDLLSSSPQKIVLTGLQDSTNYDVHVFYQSQTGSRLISKALQLNSTFFTGAGGNPASVSGFKVSVHEGIGYFEWTANSEIDLSHYFLRFTGLTTGATWETSQTLAADVRTNRVSFPIQIGTYLIKAIDLSGNESDTATTILSENSGNLINVVENLSGQTGWTGTKVNTRVEGTSLTLIDTSSAGYYYYPQIDVGAVYQSVISSSILAVPTEFLNIRSVAVIRDTAVIRGAAGTLIRSFGSIRDLTSVRGITPDIWSVTLEMRQSDDNITFTAWEEFVNGSRSFRYIEFRLVLNSSNVNVTPKVSTADVSVDMPDRYETGEDMDCPIGGATVVYGMAFKNNPSVNITLQNGSVDDKIEFISKTNTGFVIKVYNNAASGYVARSFDFISAGYGRTS